MLRKNLDFFGIAVLALGFALVGQLPPPAAMAAPSSIHLQNAVIQDHCPLMDGLSSLLHSIAER